MRLIAVLFFLVICFFYCVTCKPSGGFDYSKFITEDAVKDVNLTEESTRCVLWIYCDNTPTLMDVSCKLTFWVAILINISSPKERFFFSYYSFSLNVFKNMSFTK
ncbi:uncharacterized protein LOC122509191 isoform X2 [Leptopilina heterotoma]|uniref:uncharacterized protein LOC122509191 isoform X2 n=1 Tax=Leptopilina heterotoma TaxID=63436 RepID=UPI001CA931D1|nr:uncharacterized protein LOC122509191 isoform X2 [Leptopilina heterotoma]